MMHILILSTGYPNDYSPLEGIFYKDQAEALAQAGHKVGVNIVGPISIKSILKLRKIDLGYSVNSEKGVKTFVYNYVNIPKFPTYRILKSLKIGMKMFEEYIIENGKPEIVHVHCYESGPLANKIRDKYNIPYVITEHSTKFGNGLIPVNMEKYARNAFGNSSVNIAVSKEFALLLSKKYSREFQYIPNIVNTDLFNIETNKSMDPFVFINAAGLNDNKNHVLLLNSFARHLEVFPKSILKIAGGGINEKSLKKLTFELGIEHAVMFLGEISRELLQSEMKAAHVFVLSSRIETFGVVIIEALSCGLPVVSTRCGGPETIITKAAYGELCEQNVADFTAAMSKLYLNYEQYEPMSLRDYVENNFSNRAVVEKLTSVYKNILS